jgi:hypothetical protein
MEFIILTLKPPIIINTKKVDRKKIEEFKDGWINVYKFIQ